jgi:hypothetical protein
MTLPLRALFLIASEVRGCGLSALPKIGPCYRRMRV